MLHLYIHIYIYIFFSADVCPLKSFVLRKHQFTVGEVNLETCRLSRGRLASLGRQLCPEPAAPVGGWAW